MTECAAIGQYHFLSRRIYESYEISVDYQALADADKPVVILLEHVGDAPLYLSQLQGEDKVLTVGRGDDRIIPVGCDIYHRTGRDTEHLRGSGENKTLIHKLDSAKLIKLCHIRQCRPDMAIFYAAFLCGMV